MKSMPLSLASMPSITSRWMVCALWCLSFTALPLLAQVPAFNCGSNGSYGPMNITQNTTLPLPPDGIFHCTTVSIASGITLRFIPNALNSPVYILATGDVTILGTIDVSGSSPVGGGLAGGIGGPGGFAGGKGAISASFASGPGEGPGGGGGATATSGVGSYGSGGGFRTAGDQPYGIIPAGVVYGNSLLIPLVGGSGGGGSIGFGGSGGGGALLIASNTKVIFGSIGPITAGYVLARGSTSPGYQIGSGSGGAIRIVSPLVSGRCSSSIRNGIGSATLGMGRFRIDAYDTTGFSITPGYDAPDAVGSVMVIFPSPLPKLSIASAAGTTIAENATTPVLVNLPTGSPTNQVVRVRARDFGGIVPIRLRLVPESGAAVTVDSTIDNTVNNPATVDIPVMMPVNTGVNVQVYTR